MKTNFVHLVCVLAGTEETGVTTTETRLTVLRDGCRVSI